MPKMAVFLIITVNGLFLLCLGLLVTCIVLCGRQFPAGGRYFLYLSKETPYQVRGGPKAKERTPRPKL